MIPVAVSVPETLSVQITMKATNWAFGDVIGKPRF